MVIWRTNPDVFFKNIKRRGESTIPSPEILGRSKEYIRAHTIDDAFKTRNMAMLVSLIVPPPDVSADLLVFSACSQVLVLGVRALRRFGSHGYNHSICIGEGLPKRCEAYVANCALFRGPR